MSAGKFTGVFEVGQVFVVGDDSNRMRCTLNVLAPFSKSKNDRKEFAVIDVVVPFSWEKSTRKVGARMEIAIDVSLE